MLQFCIETRFSIIFMNAIISRQEYMKTSGYGDWNPDIPPKIERATGIMKMVLKLKSDPNVEIHSHHPVETENSIVSKEDQLNFFRWTTSEKIPDEFKVNSSHILGKLDRLLKSQDSESEWTVARNELINRMKELDATVENLELKKRYWDVGFQRLLKLNALPEYEMETTQFEDLFTIFREHFVSLNSNERVNRFKKYTNEDFGRKYICREECRRNLY